MQAALPAGSRTVMFGMTRGEIALVAFIFLLIYGAILLPRLAEKIGGSKPPPAG